MTHLHTPCCGAIVKVDMHYDDIIGFYCDDCGCTWAPDGNIQATCSDHNDVVTDKIFPSGCSACGREERSHGMTWMSGVGFHLYIEPTQSQRKQRMIKRRLASANSI